MTTTKKDQRFFQFETNAPLPGILSSYASNSQKRHGTAWDLRAYDGKGEPPIKIIKGEALEGSSTQQS